MTPPNNRVRRAPDNVEAALNRFWICKEIDGNIPDYIGFELWFHEKVEAARSAPIPLHMKSGRSPELLLIFELIAAAAEKKGSGSRAKVYSCVCRKLRFEHIGDVIHRPWHGPCSGSFRGPFAVRRGAVQTYANICVLIPPVEWLSAERLPRWAFARPPEERYFLLIVRLDRLGSLDRLADSRFASWSGVTSSTGVTPSALARRKSEMTVGFRRPRSRPLTYCCVKPDCSAKRS